MSEVKKAAIYVAVLTVVIGLLIWHVINWHSTGMYLKMYDWLQAGRGYITVLYNLGLLLAVGSLLGLLMKKIADLLAGIRHKKEGDLPRHVS